MFTIKNSCDLVNKLNSVQLAESYMMVSFDVTNLYTSIPKLETIPIISDILIESGLDLTSVNIIAELLQLCLQQDFFLFNTVVYEQPHGLAMGNPLSCLLADYFLDHYERILIPDLMLGNLVFWARYVDDCFAIIDGGQDQITFTLDALNNMHPSLSFTVESEVDKTLNFLDLTVVNTSDSFQYAIYRKPTQTDHMIPKTSNHSNSHKMAALNCYIHRLLNIPLSEDNFKREVNTIKQIAVNNGYNHTCVDRILNKIRNKRDTALAYNTSSPPNPKFCSLPYLGPISVKISKILSTNLDNLKISYRSTNTLASRLVNSKQKLSHLCKSGVYKLNCADCSCSYIGKTTRSLSTRIKEHISRPNTSVFGHHLNYSNHNFSPTSNSKILHPLSNNNFKKNDYLEDLEIKRESSSNSECLNLRMNVFNDRNPIFNLFT